MEAGGDHRCALKSDVPYSMKAGIGLLAFVEAHPR
jgi:hypothetical protein